MKNILVPIDGSKNSLKAAETALEIACKFNSEVTLLSIVNQQVMYNPSAMLLNANATNTMIEAGQAIMKEEKASKEKILSVLAAKFKEKNISVSTLVDVGIPHDKILEIADQKNIDIIVIGSRGLSATKRFILGSVSEKVVFRAKCNVLVVKPSKESKPANNK